MDEKKEVKKIWVIASDKFWYISFDPREGTYTNRVNGYLYDGEPAKLTFDSSWLEIKPGLKKLEKIIPGERANERYKLSDEYTPSGDLPEIIKSEDIERNNDGEGYGKLYALSQTSMYKYIYDTLPDTREEIPIELNVIIKASKIKQYGGWSYPCDCRDVPSGVNQDTVIYQVIDTIVWPSILLPSRPAKLNEAQSYGIIRAHVKRNIDFKYAEIKSDYDFHFEVCKKISMAKPYTETREAVDISFSRSRRKKKPRIIEFIVENKSIPVLDISTDGRYGPAIKPFEGNNAEDLQKNIDEYLADIMKVINEPIVECKHCIGYGMVLDENLKKNARENKPAKSK